MKRKSRGNKYGAIKTRIDDIVFDSKAEARYYRYLKAMQKAGTISSLTVHPRYPIVYTNTRVCFVVLDFEYVDSAGKPHFIDVKGVYTALSRLKHKLFSAFYDAEVEIVRNGKRI